jgi:hypothetical protein
MIISQDKDEIFLTLASYSQEYIEYLSRNVQSLEEEKACARVPAVSHHAGGTHLHKSLKALPRCGYIDHA